MDIPSITFTASAADNAEQKRDLVLGKVAEALKNNIGVEDLARDLAGSGIEIQMGIGTRKADDPRDGVVVNYEGQTYVVAETGLLSSR